MRAILQYNPIIIFLISISPLIKPLFFKNLFISPIVGVTISLTSFIIVAGWVLGVIDFVNKELKNTYSVLHHIAKIITAIYVILLVTHFVYYLAYSHIIVNIFKVQFLLHIIGSIIAIYLVKKYLYARSIGFIILEVLFSPIGIIGLTPSLLEEKRIRDQANKNLDNLFELGKNENEKT